MHITAVNPGLSSQNPDTVVPLSDRLVHAEAGEPEIEPEEPGSQDFVGDTVRRILRDKMVAMIMGADEEESGLPPLDYEL
ncbi:hypothetical protein [Pinirhizobacter soli]|uniref:hypothetical protein n=1 Tax=Pinirhizobacter soli TaxID=2786953 RepID=UPI00202A3F1A|nr:hypothetical protein [Pinirhizobacter soli]